MEKVKMIWITEFTWFAMAALFEVWIVTYLKAESKSENQI